jgi:hypothetical protein
MRALFQRSKPAVDVKKELAENNACYVLITCGHPSQDGKMQVEMSYQGDPTLAAYLVENAQNLIDADPS